ncbi:hypothetical protein ACM64Y_00670 [Novispirillum sp. DQ9]|uniref:hypothetical protein n=1 Tax=Novispirillum sp. DQ9 TaxID=3398612 RepID=UPI003C7C0020
MTAYLLDDRYNAVVTGALSAGSEVSTYPVSNLQDPSGGASRQWRTLATVTSAGGATIDIDAGSAAATWRALCLFRTNLTLAATIRWVVGTTAGGSDVHDTGTVSAGVVATWGQSVTLLGASVTGRYCRCYIDDPDNADGHIGVALAYAGPVTTLLPGLATGQQWIPRAVGRAPSETRSGGIPRRAGFVRRMWPARVEYTGVAGSDAIEALRATVQAGGNVGMIADFPALGGLGKTTLYGTLADHGAGGPTHQTARADLMTQEFTIMEAI